MKGNCWLRTSSRGQWKLRKKFEFDECELRFISLSMNCSDFVPAQLRSIFLEKPTLGLLSWFLWLWCNCYRETKLECENDGIISSQILLRQKKLKHAMRGWQLASLRVFSSEAVDGQSMAISLKLYCSASMTFTMNKWSQMTQLKVFFGTRASKMPPNSRHSIV